LIFHATGVFAMASGAIVEERLFGVGS